MWCDPQEALALAAILRASLLDLARSNSSKWAKPARWNRCTAI